MRLPAAHAHDPLHFGRGFGRTTSAGDWRRCGSASHSYVSSCKRLVEDRGVTADAAKLPDDGVVHDVRQCYTPAEGCGERPWRAGVRMAYLKLRLDYGTDGLDVDLPDERVTIIEPMLAAGGAGSARDAARGHPSPDRQPAAA